MSLEFLTNSTICNRYFYDDIFVQAELEKHLEGKRYSGQTEDMMSYALANAISTALRIYAREYVGSFI